MAVELTRVYRGGRVESVHRGSIAVVDSRGRLLAFAGDPATMVCLRSVAKPFQAIPLLEYGGLAEFDLSGEEIALTCASHGGEMTHVSTAAALLRKGEFDEEDLLCGTHFPFDEKSAADLRASGEAPSPLHNNCSGKHAGMLLATQLMDLAPTAYTSADHPLQQLILTILAEFADVQPEEVPVAVDGCGAPAYFLSLARTALAYARLMATSEGAAAPGALHPYAGSSSHIVDAMTSFPEYVAGTWSITTDLMSSFAGGLLSKDGAEGVYAMALSSGLAEELKETLHLEPGCSVGVALKIDDGSMSRGRNQAILRLLELLGLDLGLRPALDPWRRSPLHNHYGTLVGELRAEFELEEV